MSELGRIVDPRLEWVHDKVMGPSRDTSLDISRLIAWGVRSGGATVRTAAGTWQIGPGDWVLLLPGRRHQSFGEGTRLWSISYRMGRLRRAPWYVAPQVLVLGRSPDLDSTAQGLIARIEAAAGVAPLGERFDWECDPVAWLGIDAAFRAWIAGVMSALLDRGIALTGFGGEDPRALDALSRIEDDPWSEATAPAALAAAIGISRRRLEQLFLTAFGQGLAEARHRRRVEAAQDLLARSDQPIKRLALRLGFGSQAGFSAWFRRHAGMAPRLFRSGHPTDA